MTAPQLQQEFKTITKLIRKARQWPFAKANRELVSLYFRIGKAVSQMK